MEANCRYTSVPIKYERNKVMEKNESYDSVPSEGSKLTEELRSIKGSNESSTTGAAGSQPESAKKEVQESPDQTEDRPVASKVDKVAHKASEVAKTVAKTYSEMDDGRAPRTAMPGTLLPALSYIGQKIARPFKRSRNK